MYEELYRFLIRHHQLPVPGIGVFSLERHSAQLDFPNKTIDSPTYTITMRPPPQSPSRKFLCWLADALQSTEREAILQFNDFLFDVKRQIGEGKIVNWKGVGTLSKGLGGEIKFVPGFVEQGGQLPAMAERVIREKATHMIRVGETEKSSTEMTRILNLPVRPKSFRQWIAWGLIVLSIFFIIFYFSNHESIITASANRGALTPLQPAHTYSRLP